MFLSVESKAIEMIRYFGQVQMSAVTIGPGSSVKGSGLFAMSINDVTRVDISSLVKHETTGNMKYKLSLSGSMHPAVDEYLMYLLTSQLG